ncbi:MAG: hypothetical protein EPO40_03065 [Myxococcaceae bacterium]|nr:MAG: hypothetical protein EPO40_03065 [Myxococcaceae bacterium]
MPEWPKRFHPARPDDDGDGLDVDTSTVVEGFQVQPSTWDACAAWCGGVRVLDPITGNQAVAVGGLDTDQLAQLGDFVMAVDDRHVVDRADGHYQRWQPAQDAPGEA